MKRWYVVQTKSNQEALAVQQLKNQRFTTFYPTFVHRLPSKKTGLILQRIKPLFPSYLFVQFDVKRHPRWKSINGTRGVRGLIGCTEDYLSPLPKGCIEEIMTRTGEKGHIIFEPPARPITEFIPGMQLEICSEGLKGFTGTYCNHTRKLVTLLITLLNQKVRVILPIDAVRAVPSVSGARR